MMTIVRDYEPNGYREYVGNGIRVSVPIHIEPKPVAKGKKCKPKGGNK